MYVIKTFRKQKIKKKKFSVSHNTYTKLFVYHSNWFRKNRKNNVFLCDVLFVKVINARSIRSV